MRWIRPPKKQLGDFAKAKGNIFYGKMLEELGRYKCTKFTTESKVVDKTHRSPFLKGLKKIGEVDEIKKFK